METEIFIAAEDPVRLVSAVVERMDIKKIERSYSHDGRNEYPPRILLKVMIYAYMRLIYSSREIERACRENNGTSRVLVFRDLNESTEEQANYLRYVELGHRSYTLEKFEEIKDLLGVTVLQTTLYDKTPQEIYELYKKRWQIETYFNYFKNTADYNALHLPDYYKTQGLAFVMLIEALICRDFQEAMKDANVKGKSIRDCLLDARLLKIHKRKDSWQICNCKKSVLTLFELLHTPLAVDAAHT